MKKMGVLLVALCSYIVAIGQTKTYEGDMIMPKDVPMAFLDSGNVYEPGKTNCYAEYRYYDKDGQRVKHGPCGFVYYTYSGGRFENHMIGSYVNGKKDGPWSFTVEGGVTLNAFGGITSVKGREKSYYILLNFKDDKRNGSFKAHLRPNISLNGNMKNDRPIGKMEFSYDRSDVKIECKFDDSGEPCGVWKITDHSGVKKEQYITYTNGIMSRVVEIDDSTGESTVLLETPSTMKNLSAYKKVELTDVSNNVYTFYESKDGRYFTIKEAPALGVALGLATGYLKDVENSLANLGVDMGYTYVLIPADEDVKSIHIERRKKELKGKYKEVLELYHEMKGVRKKAESLSGRFSKDHGRAAYFYVDAEKIMLESLGYLDKDPKIQSIYSTLKGINHEIDSCGISEPKKIEALETVLNEMISLINLLKKQASYVFQLRQNIESVYFDIKKKDVKLYYQPMVDNKDAEGLIKFFTTEYSKYKK
ncbi:MAG: hypothetical protein IKV09_01375 [Alistipes sp.]|nr:hypothetical protein [Alistipes sp.]